jgi:acyl dehydratase
VILETPQQLKEFVGQEIAVTSRLEIKQERISAFAEATDDRQWIHVDGERARRESPFGGTVAHGFLTLSLLSHFVREAVEIRQRRMVINYGLNRVRFPAPVRAGAKVRARVTLTAAESIPDGVEATYHVAVEVEGSDKPCCVGDWVVRYYT